MKRAVAVVSQYARPFRPLRQVVLLVQKKHKVVREPKKLVVKPMNVYRNAPE